MARLLALLVGSLAASVSGAALRRVAVGNVPKGECYECEVTCFEDCLLKYDREVIQPDIEDAKKLERAKRKAARMAAKTGALVEVGAGEANYTVTRDENEFSWRTKPGPTKSEEVQAVVNHFERCLEAERCAGHRAFWRTSWNPAATRARQNPACVSAGSRPGAALVEDRASQCSKPAPVCSAKTCLSKAVQHPAFVQEQHVPLHPVKVNTFAKGVQGLEQCFKSCLAATCGCDDAPGFDVIAKMNAQVKANDANGDPVEDTPPEYNYRPAFKEECAGGMAGFKVNKGLYTSLASGWLEVCTEDFLKGMMVKDINKGMKHCQSSKAEDVEYGCIWNDKKGACVWGLKPVARCSVRFMNDKK